MVTLNRKKISDSHRIIARFSTILLCIRRQLLLQLTPCAVELLLDRADTPAHTFCNLRKRTLLDERRYDYVLP